MAVLVRVIPESPGVTLPGGWSLEAGDEVRISAAEWEQVQGDLRVSSQLMFVSSDGLPATDPPSWRDIQRAVSIGIEDPGGGSGDFDPSVLPAWLADPNHPLGAMLDYLLTGPNGVGPEPDVDFTNTFESSLYTP